MEVIWKLLHQDLPTTIVECGSGLSTIVFSKYIEVRNDSAVKPCKLISLEQDLDWVNQITTRLKILNLDRQVRILHAPVSEQCSYSISDEELGRALNGDLVDWIFIDGPSGPDGCRRGTLPMLERFARPGARWLLDDAFRDGELEFLHDWQQLQRTTVAGIWPIGKGLAMGRC
jgi:hypothetical protein